MQAREIHFHIALTPRTIRWVLAIFILARFAPEIASESYTLTTYYPAPSGVYTRMVTTQGTVLARDAGNVGIGTSAPSVKLDVNGSAHVFGTVSADVNIAAGGNITAGGNATANTVTLLMTAPLGGPCRPLGTLAKQADGTLLNCQSPGVWTRAVPTGFGGGYMASSRWSGPPCPLPNPQTGNCSCPTGTSGHNIYTYAAGGCPVSSLYLCW